MPLLKALEPMSACDLLPAGKEALCNASHKLHHTLNCLRMLSKTLVAFLCNSKLMQLQTGHQAIGANLFCICWLIWLPANKVIKKNPANATAFPSCWDIEVLITPPLVLRIQVWSVLVAHCLPKPVELYRVMLVKVPAELDLWLTLVHRSKNALNESESSHGSQVSAAPIPAFRTYLQP